MTNLIATLAERIRAGACLHCAWIGSADPSHAETLVRAGFDTALFDMQHGVVDIDVAIRGIALIALAGKPALVRIPVGEFQTASRILDAGAAAVVAPMINSVADAQAFADFMKFPPLGKRSWGPHRAFPLTGLQPQDYLHTANHFQLAIAMIETKEALAALDDILAVSGIDGVFVGPADLSITLSGGTLNPESAEVNAALAKVAARAKAHGKFASAFGLNGHHAKMLRELGYSLTSISTESALLRLGAQAELAVARG